MPRLPSLSFIGLLPLIVVPVWAAGGTYRPWQSTFLPLTLFAWICFLLPSAERPFSATFRRLLRDPAVWATLGFLGFLLLQTLNGPRLRYLDFDTFSWKLSPPPVPGLPWSISRDESWEMIRWFAPILSFTLILRHSAEFAPRSWLLIVASVNGLANAALSFVHLNYGWKRMYNIQRFGDDVYGSFGYPNHGAIYFILLTAVSTGLFLKELFTERAERNLKLLLFSALSTPVFFLAANLSTSRAGILGAWIAMGLTLLTTAVLAWPRMHPVQRLLGGFTLALGLSALAYSFYFFASPVHLRELSAATVNLDVAKEISGRWFQIDSAWRMWLDHPVYGVGGWGYRYLVSDYLPQDQWPLLQGFGKANVHHDLMQFLAEFGLIGFSLLIFIFLPWISSSLRGLFRSPTEDDSLWATPLRFSVFWGLFVLLLISQFDIPLRSPAVFIHAVLLMWTLSPHVSESSIWLPVVDWKLLQPPALRIKGRKKNKESFEEYPDLD
jgi:hypothetical protein